MPLARAWESAGHEVAFASTPAFCATIEAEGFRSFRAGIDDGPDERRQRRQQMAGLSSQEETFFTLNKVFAGVRAKRSLPDLLDIMHAWRPQVVVRENTEFAGCLAAERAGIPHAAVQITTAWTYFLQAVEAPLKRLSASIGLTPEEPAGLLYRYLLLFPRPPSLWNPSVPMPLSTHAFRYASFNQSSQGELPLWVADQGTPRLPSRRQRPTVYATLGTFENRMTEILAAILEGLREEPINLILTVGRNRDPLEFGEQPPNVHVERYIPHNLILPYCGLVLCHGGSGTIMDALSHGLPMVVIPITADQPENAWRCMEVGVARIIEAHQGAAPAGLAGTIREVTREVLGDPRYRQAAQRLRREIEELPGLEHPVALLERLAAERSPLMA